MTTGRGVITQSSQVSSLQLEERQKEEQFVQQTREIFHHRRMMIAEKEKKEKEKSEIDQELLKQRIIQDQKVCTLYVCLSVCLSVCMLLSVFSPVPFAAAGASSEGCSGRERASGLPQVADG